MDYVKKTGRPATDKSTPEVRAWWRKQYRERKAEKGPYWRKEYREKKATQTITPEVEAVKLT